MTRPYVLVSMAMILLAALALWDYSRVVVIFAPPAKSAPLDQRIESGRHSILFGHHADYALGTVDDHPGKVMQAFDRAPHYLLDTRLMMAWARGLHESGQEDKARYVAARLKEFRNRRLRGVFRALRRRGSRSQALPVPAALAQLPLRGLQVAGHAGRRLPAARLAAALLEHAHAADDHAAVDRLAHVVDGQGGRSARRTALPSRRRCGPCDSTCAVQRTWACRGVDAEVDGDARDRQRVAERHEVGGALGGLDRGDARHAQNVAFGSAAGLDPSQRLGEHRDRAGGTGDPMRFPLSHRRRPCGLGRWRRNESVRRASRACRSKQSGNDSRA